jgi:hypothetical protein
VIYLSAQPDDYYFMWQLELQIHNFKALGIKSDEIHILIGYDEKKGLRHYFSELIERNCSKARFFVYPDKRKNPKYASSIRPHLILQHFSKHSSLNKTPIFYHDSDIIFNKLPSFENLLNDNTWYVSDTKSYLDTTYIKNASNVKILKKMCEIVGISCEQVESIDSNCGGSQYLLKATNSFFWKKLEADCEKIYSLLASYNAKCAATGFKKGNQNQSERIQAWCADMWALLWNAIYFNYPVKISKELDFCWATSDFKELSEKKILHYTGVSSDHKANLFFCKTNYIKYTPFFDYSLKQISKLYASYALVELINDYNKYNRQFRINLKDVTFIFSVRLNCSQNRKNFFSNIRYLSNTFDTNILIYESDSSQNINEKMLPDSCIMYFEKNDSEILHYTRLNNLLIKKCTTRIVALLDPNILIPVSKILEAVKLVRENTTDFVLPFDNIYQIDYLFTGIFEKLLDPFVLECNENKFDKISGRMDVTCLFLNIDKYKSAGLENESFEAPKPTNFERVKRIKNFGSNIERVRGSIFCQKHEVEKELSYVQKFAYINNMNEYFRISNMRKNELEDYIFKLKQ